MLRLWACPGAGRLAQLTASSRCPSSRALPSSTRPGHPRRPARPAVRGRPAARAAPLPPRHRPADLWLQVHALRRGWGVGGLLGSWAVRVWGWASEGEFRQQAGGARPAPCPARHRSRTAALAPSPSLGPPAASLTPTDLPRLPATTPCTSSPPPPRACRLLGDGGGGARVPLVAPARRQPHGGGERGHELPVHAGGCWHTAFSLSFPALAACTRWRAG